MANSVKRAPRGSWGDTNFQREFLDKVAAALGFKQQSDWYKVTRKDIQLRGGSPLFYYYGSLDKVLKGVYPEYDWRPFQFREQPTSGDKIGNQATEAGEGRSAAAAATNGKEGQEGGALLGLKRRRLRNGFWKDKSAVMDALNWAEEKIGVSKPEDWYTVTLADLREIGWTSTISKPQLADLLTEKYPDHKWERLYQLNGRYAQQKRLQDIVEELFKGEEIKINVRDEPDLVNPLTNYALELDIYIPSLKLAFEFQEQHHYTSVDYNYTPVSDVQKRDLMKKQITKDKGITLIIVPFWWDGKRQSLVATIKKQRPDLLASYSLSDISAEPISETPPAKFFDEMVPNIDDIGQPTNACFFTLTNVNPAGWWLFEKYDGVRGFWNPMKNCFYSRKGKKFQFPKEILKAMPQDIFLDGELWFGRDTFQEAMKIANRSANADWKAFKFMVFDIPTHKGTYQERYTKLEKYFSEHPHPFIVVAPKVECKDTTHLEKSFQEIIDQGGEGVILRDPNSPFQPGRSAGYLKHKKYRDAEARIIGLASAHQWECELPNGVRFMATPGTTEFAKKWTPKPGDVVSFKHRGFLLSNRKPKFPTLHRLRPELTWDDVIHNWKEKPYKMASGMPFRNYASQKKPKGHWMDPENQRSYFIEFAKQMNFDPYKPENWNKITGVQIISKMGRGPLPNFKSSLQTTLKAAFPELEFDFSDSAKKPARYWQDVANCKQFFDSVAKEHGFDPTDVENWYSHKFPRALALNAYPGGVRAALQRAYPELQFTKWTKYAEQAEQNKYADVRICRMWFDHFAKVNGFDPQDVESWYRVPADAFGAVKGGKRIKLTHGGYRKALLKAYPELHFDPARRTRIAEQKP